MTQKTDDHISLTSATVLKDLSSIKFDIRAEVPLVDRDIVGQVVTKLQERINTVLHDNQLVVVEDQDIAPSLELFVSVNQAQDCVTGVDFFLYRVELVLREFVTLERSPSRSVVADTWRARSAVGYVAVAQGLRSLEAAVLSEVARQKKLFESSLGAARTRVAATIHPPSKQTLDATIGKHISNFCANGYTSDTTNHCAHFVSHVLNLQFGITCRDLTNGASDPASLRVHEIFANCRQVGAWDDLPVPLTWGLIFVTNPANVDLENKRMQNVANKHVGIFFGPSRTVYQYKNALRQVVNQSHSEFGQHYPAPDNGLFWGSL